MNIFIGGELHISSFVAYIYRFVTLIMILVSTKSWNSHATVLGNSLDPWRGNNIISPLFKITILFTLYPKPVMPCMNCLRPHFENRKSRSVQFQKWIRTKNKCLLLYICFWVKLIYHPVSDIAGIPAKGVPFLTNIACSGFSPTGSPT